MNKSILFLFVMIFISLKSFSCSCNPEPTFMNKEDLNNYDFIAHIKINSIDSIKIINSDSQLIHKISFKTLELFKGQNLDSILVYGSH